MDSNVENILRNMVDGTTEYDPPHSRVEKLLIELKEALDAGGGGGTVDEVARNRINTHVDNSNVHVSTAEKSSWNEKAELSDIPTTLPANGGDADTLDGLHANEIASNPNLLINPDFAVNQRGITSASGGTSSVYIADMWYSQRAIISRPENGGISIAWDGTNKDNGWVQQKIETAALFGKTVTISADIDGERKSVTTTIPNTVNKTDGAWVDSDKQVMLAVSNLGGTMMSIVIFVYTTTPIAISNVKLELGANATPYYPPDPATELAKCQRYALKVANGVQAVAYRILTNSISFFYPVPVTIVGAVASTAEFGVITGNSTEHSDFAFEFYAKPNGIIVEAKKTAHGITLSDSPILTVKNTGVFSAEL